MAIFKKYKINETGNAIKCNPIIQNHFSKYNQHFLGFFVENRDFFVMYLDLLMSKSEFKIHS